MFQAIDLRELSEMQAAERAFVSVYFSGTDGLQSLTSRERTLRDMLADSPDEAFHFEESMKLAREVLDQNPQVLDAEGVCLFSCWALDFVRGYPLTAAVPNLLRIGPAPYLRPLSEIQDEYENFLVVAADASATRIFQISSAVVQEEDRVRGNVKNRVKKGGWSQKRYARRRENQLMHYAKEVAGVIDDLCRRQTFDRIVLLGTQETLAELEEALPADLASRVIGRKGVEMHADDQTLMEEAWEIYFEEERESERRLWDRIREEFFRGGLAAAGATRVLEAALAGRIEKLLVTRDAKVRGTRCRDCEHLVHGTPQNCQSCGSKSVYQVDLVDELVRQMGLTSAEVEFADEIPGLAKVGHVAALLRY